MNKKTWIIFSVICVAVLATLVVVSRGQRINVDNVDELKVQAANQQSGDIADHVFGKADSKVVLLEYGDFQCPGCASAYSTLKTLSEEFKDEIAFVYRNFPLTSIHPNAKAAAAAAEAAGLQGKYWEMHDKLFEEQNSWKSLSISERTDRFISYAKLVGVKDEAKFKTDMASENVDQKIGFDLALGKKMGVSGTPGIFLGKDKIDTETWNDIDKFREKIEDAIEKAK